MSFPFDRRRGLVIVRAEVSGPKATAILRLCSVACTLLLGLLLAGCEPALKVHLRSNYPFEITVIRQSVPGYLKDEDTWLGTVPPKSEKTFDQTIDPKAPAHRLVIKGPDGKVVQVITESGDTLQSHITRDRPMIWTVTAGKP